MKIFNASQIRDWDLFTINNEPIASVALMERASNACARYISEHITASSFLVLAGNGNNGGDGLALARLLKQQGADVVVYQLASTEMSEDCRTNLDKLKNLAIPYTLLNGVADLPTAPSEHTWIIDAILGSGQNRALEGLLKEVVDHVNRWASPVIAIDLPTGLPADQAVFSSSVIHARYTLSFQLPKLSFFMPEHERYTGEWIVLDIGLSDRFYQDQQTVFALTEKEDARALIRPRAEFSHKGTHGTALMMAGSRGMMGAAMLAGKACLRSGVGKLVCRIPGCGVDLLQIALPEAICSEDANLRLLEHLPDDLNLYQAVGAGPGLGKAPETRSLVDQLLREIRVPLVLDADALNIIAEERWQDRIPAGSVITPHIREFERLFGVFGNHVARTRAALDLASSKGIYIILKGRYTLVATPSGHGFFNSTGNSGMAKAGSGDVLTGLITGMLAQQYPTGDACRLSAYLHGLAGDLARLDHSEYGITASDLTEKIGFCYLKVFTI